MAQAQREHASDRFVSDPWADLVGEYASNKSTITLAEILQNAIYKENKADWDQRDQNRIAKILSHLGFERYRLPQKDASGRRPYAYKKTAHFNDNPPAHTQERMHFDDVPL